MSLILEVRGRETEMGLVKALTLRANALLCSCKEVKDSDWKEKSVGLIETTAVRKVAIVGEGRR